jgi:hypothetical protein
MEIEQPPAQLTPTQKIVPQSQEDKKEQLLMIKLNNFVKLNPFISRYSRAVKLHERFGDIQWVRQHSNKLLIFGLSEQHPIFVNQSPIKSANWRICGGDHAKLSNLVKGKKKSIFWFMIFRGGCEFEGEDHIFGFGV